MPPNMLRSERISISSMATPVRSGSARLVKAVMGLGDAWRALDLVIIVSACCKAAMDLAEVNEGTWILVRPVRLASFRPAAPGKWSVR